MARVATSIRRVRSLQGRGRSRPAWLALSGVLIGIGLVWRLGRLGLPGFALKYGGSLLWASMVYSLCAALLPRQSIAATATVAGLVALSTELFRLYHQPWLDAFRLTLPGALLLGRIFSPWNLAAYAGGIGAVALCEWLIARQAVSSRQPSA
jgi:hypothetical protein